jgi:hypothetical protein
MSDTTDYSLPRDVRKRIKHSQGKKLVFVLKKEEQRIKTHSELLPNYMNDWIMTSGDEDLRNLTEFSRIAIS